MFKIIKIIFINSSLLLWAIIFTVICVEFFSRNNHIENPTYAKLIRETTDDHHQSRPYVMSSTTPGLEYQGDRHNILGYRDFPKVFKAKDEFRIIIIGGSTVHSGKITISKHLENELKISFNKNVRVYNAGVVSSVSRQDIIRIMVDLAGYSPDLIIHYGGGNDLSVLIDPRINYPHRFMFYEQNLHFTKKLDTYDWLLSLSLGSSFLRNNMKTVLRDRLMSKIQILLPPQEQYQDLKVQAYLENLNWGSILSKAIGANFLAVFQPVLHFKDFKTKQEAPHAEDNIPHIARNILYQKLARNRPTFSFIDCSDIFKENKEHIYHDIIHLNEGYRAYPAKCIAEFLFKNKNELLKKNTSEIKFTPEEYFMIGR